MTSAGEPHGKRRRRELSAEEHALWRGVARSVRPLRRHARREAEEGDTAIAAAPTRPMAKAKPVKTTAAPVRATTPATPPPLATLARREKQQLARGRTQIDARIDLHGMTQSEAHAALAHFVHGAQRKGAKFALVITGKSGVLRRQVPLWLQLPDLREAVVGFEEAHVAHGGEGALYVRLRRARA